MHPFVIHSCKGLLLCGLMRQLNHARPAKALQPRQGKSSGYFTSRKPPCERASKDAAAGAPQGRRRRGRKDNQTHTGDRKAPRAPAAQAAGPMRARAGGGVGGRRMGPGLVAAGPPGRQMRGEGRGKEAQEDGPEDSRPMVLEGAGCI
jgi:hypothetical protein